ncbi:GNAT family N-acetyltransferase [Actinospica robiniae]|uniref:GNAT family N-acetyltransferase n=1 Tax=Actinospica robiniae TaxID=304901 RepID=UPI00041FFA85|nr:GNAT family N-acetyltransferase [Actinospica robiniae]
MSVTLDSFAVPATTAAPALTLRTWRERDVPVIVAAHADPLVRGRSPQPLTDETAVHAWFERLDDGWAAGTLYVLAIVEGEEADADALGLIAVSRPDRESETADVTYWTVAERRGRAFAPRALDAVIDWLDSEAWTDDPLRTLRLTHSGDNDAACRVAEKSGFELERELAPKTPKYPLPGHLHTRKL